MDYAEQIKELERRGIELAKEAFIEGAAWGWKQSPISVESDVKSDAGREFERRQQKAEINE